MSPSATRQRSRRSPSGRRPRSTATATETASQRGVFLEQAAHCEGRSPLYAGLCRHFAEDERVARVVDAWRRDVPLRLLGGLHYLVLGGEASWEDVDAALGQHADFLRRFVAEQPVQTNEAQRSWVLLPCFLRISERTGAETLDLVELGPSAGLNLVWDRYAYSYREGDWGSPSAPLHLSGEEHRAIPARLLQLRPRIRRRLGIERSPIDVTTADGARLLASFVWADDRERLARLRRAIDALRADPPAIVEGDIVHVLPNLLARRPDDGLTVVFQTGVLGYLDEAGRARVRDALRSAGEHGPLAFVSTGRPRRDQRNWGVRIVVWPDGEREFVAHADYHGRWLDWEP